MTFLIERYHLITISETPHDDTVTCLHLRPRPEASSFDEMAVTASKDGKIKFWVLKVDGKEGTIFIMPLGFMFCAMQLVYV